MNVFILQVDTMNVWRRIKNIIWNSKDWLYISVSKTT